MIWLPFALFSAFISASRRVYEKNLTASFGNFSLGFIIKAFAILPALSLLIFLPIPENLIRLPWRFWWPLLIIWFVLYPIQSYFFYRALREGELSHVAPVTTILPALNMVSSYFLLGELPNLIGIIAIFVIMAGVYLLLTDSARAGAHKHNKAVIYMIIATTCIAIGTTLDKISIGVSTPAFYSFVNTLGASVILLALSFIYRQAYEIKKAKIIFWPLALLGVFQALAYTSIIFAFSYGPTSYVLAVTSGSFIISSLFGILFLKERVSMRKLLAFLLFITGIIFIAFGH